MYSIQTDRLIGYSDIRITDGIIQKKAVEEGCIDILSIKPSNVREYGFVFYDKNDESIEICHIGITWQRNKTEVSYGTELSYWSKGYMQEALKAFIEWFSKNTIENKLWALPNGNTSEHILKKCGFRFYGTVKDSKSSWYVFDIKR